MFFFQPLQLHLEPTDLLIQLRNLLRLGVLPSRTWVFENLRHVFQQLFLPLPDQARMHRKLAA